MKHSESTTSLRFVPTPLPKNTTLKGVSLENSLTADSIFGSPDEEQTAQIQRGVEKSIIKRLTQEQGEADIWLDPLQTFKEGVESVVKDSFTECFRPKAPEAWNFGPVLFVLWVLGLAFRTLILFPIRVLLLFTGSVVFAIGCVILTVILPFVLKKHKRDYSKTTDAEEASRLQMEDDLAYKKLVNSHYQRWLYLYECWWLFSLAIVIKTHGIPPVKRPNQIYVANHTSLIDFLVLGGTISLSSVGQKHGGLVGFIQDRMISGIWFERFETSQRLGAADLIQNWIANPSNDRLLIFPEGVCVNNEYCVMFKKRVFEIPEVEICPIAVKYNKAWSDPYWSSKDESFMGHIFRLMRSWCTVCDVRFLEATKMRDGENSIEFCNRVKADIAKRAGLKNLSFDGYLKYYVASEKLGDRRKKIWAEKLLQMYPEVANVKEVEGDAKEEESSEQKKNN
jgi:glycerol-3-phosphate O-acyltransferase 3/4